MTKEKKVFCNIDTLSRPEDSFAAKWAGLATRTFFGARPDWLLPGASRLPVPGRVTRLVFLEAEVG